MVSRERVYTLRVIHWTLVLLLGLFNAMAAFATQYEPWVGNFLEFESRNSLLYQHYSSLNSNGRSIHSSADDLFLNASLSNSLPNISLELELIAANTRYQRGDIDSFNLTARYVWLDDVIGDFVSLATGVHLVQAFHHSVKDISSFHHGKAEGEIFISVGKETAQETWWSSRWWAMGAIGSADVGSAWLRGNFVYEKRFAQEHILRGFCNLLWGMGTKRLNPFHFKGYGSVGHESVDLGLRYIYEIPFVGNLSLEYSYRVFARNFPANASVVMGQLFCTFGL